MRKGEILLQTACGALRGVDTGRCAAFLGVPFAKAERFCYAERVDRWEGTLDATRFGPGCPQNRAVYEHLEHPTRRFYKKEYREGLQADYSEDCLNLNIYVPYGAKNAPVILFFFGGGFDSGLNAEDTFDGEALAELGIITVFANYRVGILGYLTHEEVKKKYGREGNFGLDDQLTALRWVRAHIADFGGNAENLTLMGQSAGAMSVQTLVTSPLSKDLVAGAIIQSGGGLTDGPLLGGTPLAEAETTGKELMEWAGFEILEQMRAASPEELLAIPMRYMMEKKQYLRLSPVVDGYAYPETFQEAARAGRIANVPYMIGGTLDDMGGLANGIDRFCFAREEAGIPAYAYQFARRLPTDGREGVLQGAFHSSELWYMFKSLRFCWRPFVPGDYDLAEQMITFWTNFSATGDPNGAWPEIWTPCTAASPEFMILKLDEEGQVASRMEVPSFANK